MFVLVSSLLAATRRPRSARPQAALPSSDPAPLDALPVDALPGWAWVAAVAGVALVLLLGLAAFLFLQLRRRQQRRRRRAPRYPVVLAHGLLGFDEIRVGPLRRLYFKDIPLRLGLAGVEVHRPTVAMAGSISARAAQLAARVRAIPAPRVCIVAHSMGGLDARYAIAHCGLDGKVAALVTVGTPHRGTPIADLGTEMLGEKLGLRRAFSRVGLGLEAFYDLTSARMEAFNRETEDHRRTVYASVVAVAPDAKRVHPLLLPSYLYLRERAGPNDGLVPRDSQQWGDVLAEVEADHWAQVGWSRRFDAAALYERIIGELRGWGF